MGQYHCLRGVKSPTSPGHRTLCFGSGASMSILGWVAARCYPHCTRLLPAGTTRGAIMPRLRIPIPHCRPDAPIIDAFQCSECEWSYLMRQPKPDTISYEDAERASREFDGHRCEDFKPRRKTPAKVSSLSGRMTFHSFHGKRAEVATPPNFTLASRAS